MSAIYDYHVKVRFYYLYIF